LSASRGEGNRAAEEQHEYKRVHRATTATLRCNRTNETRQLPARASGSERDSDPPEKCTRRGKPTHVLHVQILGIGL